MTEEFYQENRADYGNEGLADCLPYEPISREQKLWLQTRRDHWTITGLKEDLRKANQTASELRVRNAELESIITLRERGEMLCVAILGVLLILWQII